MNALYQPLSPPDTSYRTAGIITTIAAIIGVIGIVAWSNLAKPAKAEPPPTPYVIFYQHSTTSGIRVANLIIHSKRFGLAELREAVQYVNGGDTNSSVVILSFLRLDP